MGSAFGYNSKKKSSTVGNQATGEVTEAQIEFMTTKIDSLKLHLDDLDQFFAKNRAELPAAEGAKNDTQIFWEKKIALLKQKVGTLPQSLQRAIKNNQRAIQAKQKQEMGGSYGLRNRNNEGRRRME